MGWARHSRKRGIYWEYDNSLRLLDVLNSTPNNMPDLFRASSRSTSIEYAIRDVVVPATKLEAQGNEIIRLNIGDPLALSLIHISEPTRPERIWVSLFWV